MALAMQICKVLSSVQVDPKSFRRTNVFRLPDRLCIDRCNFDSYFFFTAEAPSRLLAVIVCDSHGI